MPENLLISILAIIFAVIVGVVIGFFLLRLIPSIKAKNAEKKAEKIFVNVNKNMLN